jgi:hypothetical protein
MAVLVVLAVLAGMAWWRWGLVGLAVAAGIAMVGWLIVWAVVMPSRLAPPLREPDLAELPDAKARLEATDARTRLHHDLRNGALQLLTVLAVLVGAGLGFRQLAEDRDQASQDHDQAIEDRQLTRQGQASERFTRAIDQLGSTRVETRIGGIYGLDQIAEQSPDSTGPVAEVLLAWLHSRPRPRTAPHTPLRQHAPDMQAALSVLTGRRYTSIVTGRLDLHRLGLREANLRGANLRGADLRDAYLVAADLRDANIYGAKVRDANLAGAVLRNANLYGSDLSGVRLLGADLGGADLRAAYLFGADLRQVSLHYADLSEATNLNDADLNDARVDPSTRWPTLFDWRKAGARVEPYP